MQLTTRFAKLAAVASLAACSSTVTDFGDSFPSAVGGTAFPPPDASAPPNPEGDCPATKPNAGDRCASTASLCQYGFEMDENCNEVATCHGGSWSLSTPFGSCEHFCPAAFDTFDQGAACPHAGTVCSFVEASCGCVGPDAGDAGTDDGAGDGGPDAAATPGTWICTRPAAGCPARRPRNGTECVHTMNCDYGSCLFGRDLSWSCDSNVWDNVASYCP